MGSPDLQSRLAADAVTAAGGTPQQFGEVIRADMEKWRGIVKQADIKLN